MQVHRDIDNLPQFRKGVVTIGTFDGVHLGHCQILSQLREEARRIDGETVIITFHPHPRKIVGTATSEIQLLNTIDEKISLLESNGIDHLIVVPFTEAFSRLSAGEYIQDFLVGRFDPHTVIIGYDHRFGQGRKGDYKLLEEFSAKLGFTLREISPHVINSNTVSSTLIRQSLLRGDISAANLLLGYQYFITGKVVEGNKLGRTLGYPTANIEIAFPEKLVPAIGIYAVKVIDESESEKELKGMMSIGIRPTIDDLGIRTIEVNLFDFNKDIYGHTLRVLFVAYLREEKKFNGLEALKDQMALDKIESMKVLG